MKIDKRKIRKILKRYMRRSFYEVLTVAEYVNVVKKRLKSVGVIVSSNPVKFFNQMRELGFYRKGSVG